MPTYLITGARQGLGLGFVRHLATSSKDNLVFALVRDLKSNLADLESLRAKGPGRVYILECDTASSASIHLLPGLIGATAGPAVRLDYIVNAAGVLQGREDVLHMRSEALVGHVAANVLGPLLVVQALLPFLSASAVVANASSAAGSLAMVGDGRAGAGLGAYGISKAALNMATVMLARELHQRAVVVAVEPGHLDTAMGKYAGPGPYVSVGESVQGILGLLEGLRGEDTGKFFDYKGRKLEW